jgi:hypothetical protein
MRISSYKNKKRKRNLAKKAKKKILLIERISSSWVVPIEWKSVFDILFEETMLGGDIPKAIDNLPKGVLTKEQLEILKKRATN